MSYGGSFATHCTALWFLSGLYSIAKARQGKGFVLQLWWYQWCWVANGLLLCCTLYWYVPWYTAIYRDLNLHRLTVDPEFREFGQAQQPGLIFSLPICRPNADMVTFIKLTSWIDNNYNLVFKWRFNRKISYNSRPEDIYIAPFLIKVQSITGAVYTNSPN